jgi:hypothetical protein
MMKYYKDNLGNIFAYELDGSQDDLIGNKTQLTSAELDAHLTPPPQIKTKFTSLEYLKKFTEAEQLTVVTATLANAQIKLWYDKMIAATFVDLNDPLTSAGLDALIAANLLAPSRKAQILEPEVIA